GMTTEAKDLYRRWIEELWGGSPDQVAELAPQIVAEEFVGHWPGMWVQGPDELAAVITGTQEMFTDLTFEIEVGPLAEGDLVAGRWSGSGTVDGKRQRFVGNDVLRYDGSRFTEYWVATVTSEDEA